jgi:hypothetical protein
MMVISQFFRAAYKKMPTKNPKFSHLFMSGSILKEWGVVVVGAAVYAQLPSFTYSLFIIPPKSYLMSTLFHLN